MAVLQVVTERTDEGRTVYDFRCPYPVGCGTPDTGDDHVPFNSTGWNRRDDAVERGKQHIREHETGEPMPELGYYRAARGLTQANAGEALKPPEWTF